MEEHRKVIQFGESSHIISLPSNWIKKNNIKKGSTLKVEETNSGELVIYNTQKKQETKETTIDISNKDIEDINRELVSAYINNYKIITLSGKDLKSSSKKIKELTNRLLALQVIQETKEQLVVKDFLNIEDISIKDIVRRLDIIIKSMLEDSKNSILGENEFVSLYERDLEVNKFTLLIHRLTKGALTNSAYLKSLNSSCENMRNIWWIVTTLEKIGDDTKRFSRDLKKINMTKEEKQELLGICSLIEEQYNNTTKALFTNDKSLAIATAGNKKRILDICKEFEIKTNYKVNLVTEKLKAIESFIKVICRVVIDNEKENIIHD